MIVRESINFERGVEPKVSMGIGNKWARIKKGDIIECIRRVLVKYDRESQLDYLAFMPPDKIDNDPRDYYFDIGNVAIADEIREENGSLKMVLIPMDDEKGALEIQKRITGLSRVLYARIPGDASIETWAKYFKVTHQ